MPQVVHSDSLDPRFLDVCLESMGKRVFVDRILSPEKERALSLVFIQCLLQSCADRRFSDLLVLGGGDIIGFPVYRFSAVGLIEPDSVRFDVLRRECQHFAPPPSGIEQHDEDGSVCRVIDRFDEPFKFFFAPKLHFRFGNSPLWLFDFPHMGRVSVAAFAPFQKCPEIAPYFGEVFITVWFAVFRISHCPQGILPLIQPFFCHVCDQALAELRHDIQVINLFLAVDGTVLVLIPDGKNVFGNQFLNRWRRQRLG